MAATDKPYRSPKALDIVFAVSCILMLLSTVWMFSQDYYREFKTVQREFRDVEEAIAERAMLAKLPEKEEVEAAVAKVEDAKRKVVEEEAKVGDEVKKLLTEQAKANADASSLKADFDSQSSLYDIAVEKLGEADSSSRQSFADRVAQQKKKVDELKSRLDEANLRVETVNTQLKETRAGVIAAEKAKSDAEDNLKKITGDFDRFAKAAAQKKWKFNDWFRNLPVIDAFASPTKIQQYVLDDLTIDYAFKRVPRFERCTTCHLGIDRANYDKETLRGLRTVDEGLADKLKTAHQLLEERKNRKESLGFDPNDIPKEVWTKKLSEADVRQYCAHPHLDLFVDANSPHPIEKFGCTACHNGQGSATEFTLAAHTPNDIKAKRKWTDGPHGWESSHFWDFPMLPRRFIEASCLKCHHQVVDLVPAAAKSEMREGTLVAGPGSKVLRGYNLIRENGCFGCHEIAGMKSGRAVGPDLRLEPNPPLEDLTPTERADILGDAQNPPGTLRKVGPSLYRISEKTNLNWTRKWIESPRSYRPDTKMPHFYGLSNNRREVLPNDQKDFPDAEIHSIAYYLFRESQDYLAGKDTYRTANAARLEELQEKQKNNLLSDPEKKELVLISRRMENVKTPVPLTKQLLGSDGKPTMLSTEPKDLEEGKHLFTIKGCMACHSHREAPIPGEGNFGPNLSLIAAKIKPESGDNDAARRWLTQWIMNPNLYHPRTRMPVTQLGDKEAAAIAAWLLKPQNTKPETEEWAKEEDVAKPESDTLAALARVYLVKAPGMTRQSVNDILAVDAGSGNRRGLSAEQIKYLTHDADERRLESPLDDDKLKWYIGKKSISRLGCFGCHNVPGFELAKPIGTPLNEWGKKDAERIAFEDINAYAKEHYHTVDSVTTEKGYGPRVEDGKEPYDAFFMDALEHHTREGFLHQKLVEPRSYDYNRLRTWDDRLRMPQFRFARDAVKPLDGETRSQAELRAEADAREAVMTFVLGLVAEPISAKYIYSPPTDRLAEVKGQHVLDKFNCAGCHQLKPGTYEFKVPEDGRVTEGGVLETLLKQHASAKTSLESDYPEVRDFRVHNAWTGPSQTRADRVTLYGLPLGSGEAEVLGVRATQAVRFSAFSDETKARATYDIPAGTNFGMPSGELAGVAEPVGGTFTNLAVPYLTSANLSDAIKKTLPDIQGDRANARSYLPPPLLRVGEKLQPAWLFQFLRNPEKVRPQAVLRMPRFNMSDDEAMMLVNYFAAVDKLKNPGIGLNSPYLTIDQRDDGYWRTRGTEYKSRLGNKAETKQKELQPLWEQYVKDQLTEANRRLAAAEVEVKVARDAEAKKKAEENRDSLKKDLQDLQAQADKKELLSGLENEWKEGRAYATDAYRMLANSPCLSCHQVPSLGSRASKYPSLGLSPDRIRPDWLLRWLASPQRMMIYPEGPHPMPANFPRDDKQPWWTDFAASSPDKAALEKAAALRDILMDLPKVSELPANRYYRAAAPGEQK